jgi:hypothetical protein
VGKRSNIDKLFEQLFHLFFKTAFGAVASLCVIMALYAGFMIVSCGAAKILGFALQACGVR